MCGYLEDYFSATAKVQKSQSKDYEKILKVSGALGVVAEVLKHTSHAAGAGTEVVALLEWFVHGLFLRAWKHMCGYLEDYFSATAKVQKSQSKDYEKILNSSRVSRVQTSLLSVSGIASSSLMEVRRVKPLLTVPDR
jgi:hypothetical protein